MDQPALQPEHPGFDWNWVGLTLVLFLFLYFLPIYLVGGLLSGVLPPEIGNLFVGIWSFAGVVIVAGVAGFLSPGVTIREPAVAGVFLMVGWFFVFHFSSPHVRGAQTLMPMIVTAVIVGLLSLFGAWIGEKLQSGRKQGPSQSPTNLR
ncbi:MAG: hypothetical protein A2X67_14970 [Ignavibacteria bacterium GWA2_55_11]|nr:MAG: hypothetical protein A2X67_14970 [Ignavibacteria bacterium GWA2_55_11]OGU47216.1 MAG: hypothetical protein A2X68_11475 [Ignavibacteria bacterium GWC2_56_12]OGU66511.1 MAG: hypothetical protein A3C56_03000 [Ignavibacteria bacterium RIFCSPHIGHO2_02_FULL_56_12]OGU73557.1 MAG: hypothetical protein A3G43_00540 [Ignavibacteria bacterium RIFCSPLOWO2_12_FULL_56_21]OGU74139.1 MAG: hypothetical protein A3H45_07190 [Ignavibacteria bacterium RIFCSPLOWO2_02_FULL_55_14]HAV22989.1 hypothetical protei